MVAYSTVLHDLEPKKPNWDRLYKRVEAVLTAAQLKELRRAMWDIWSITADDLCAADPKGTMSRADVICVILDKFEDFVGRYSSGEVKLSAETKAWWDALTHLEQEAVARAEFTDRVYHA